MPKPVPATETRTLDELREHYEVEKELANRLRSAGAAERLTLYASLYDELFARVPRHPQLERKIDPVAAAAAVDAQVQMLRPYAAPTSTFLEIGAGDCALAIAMAPRVQRVYALEVSEAIIRGVALPENAHAVVSDGVEIPVEEQSVDVAFSNQVMEHLHPDDAQLQLANIRSSLKPGGAYICITPNQLTGPHDISAFFDDEPTGFHMREYSVRSITRMFRGAGFDSVRVLVGARGRFAAVTPLPIVALEAGLGRLSPEARRRLVRRLRLNALLGIRVLARRAR